MYYSDIISAFQDPAVALAPLLDFRGSNLEYRFPRSQNGLHGFSFTEQSGRMVGIMGASGSGKSTLLGMLQSVPLLRTDNKTSELARQYTVLKKEIARFARRTGWPAPRLPDGSGHEAVDTAMVQQPAEYLSECRRCGLLTAPRPPLRSAGTRKPLLLYKFRPTNSRVLVSHYHGS